jgi:hypothetical protein
MENAPKEQERAVVVTTQHRGVFVGYTTDADDSEIVRLTRARMVVYYSRETRSVVGLASSGPGAGSRVSHPVPRIALRNITAVIDATPEAAAAWERGPWS